MSQVLVYTADLLFGSKLVEAVQSAGYQSTLCLGEQQFVSLSQQQAGSGQGVVVDLAAEVKERLAVIKRCCLPATPVLACYSHVEPRVAKLARESGCALAVPRSRFMRETKHFLQRLFETSDL